MALGAFSIASIFIAAAAPALAFDHLVGDNIGWNTGFNYTFWSEGRDFHVGDSLMFMYTREQHNVIMVDGAGFEGCIYSNATDKIWSSGFDVVPLAVPGKQWYMSGVDDDCSQGMKLAVTVTVAEEPAPAPIPGFSAPPPGASAAGGEVSPIKSCVCLLAAMAAYRMTVA